MNTNKLQDYILLRADSLRLIVPQEQMQSIAHVQNRRQANENVLKSFAELKKNAQGKETIYSALSENLTILSEIPNDRFVQTAWKIAPELHWCWSEIRLMNGVKITKSSIPEVIKSPNMPLDGIVTLVDGSIAFTCETLSLLTYLHTEDSHG